VKEGDVQALKAGNNNDWYFLEMVCLPLNSIQNPLSLGIMSCNPAANSMVELPCEPVHAGKSLLDLRVLDYDKFPILGVATGRRSQGELYEAKD
jgi:hypothetical protein